MNRAELIAHLCEQLELNRYQAATIAKSARDQGTYRFHVLRATYPGGAPNPIMGDARTWGFAAADESYRVTCDHGSFTVDRMPAGH